MATPIEWLNEFQVNTGTAATGAQSAPHVVGLSNGNILVAWQESVTGVIGTAAGTDIIGKIYNTQGTVVRDAFQLNSDRVVDNEGDFDVAATNDGGFILAYVDDDISTPNLSSIYWERFNANGDVLGGAAGGGQLASENVAADFLANPQVAVNLDDNSFVVTYTDRVSGDTDISARRVDASGTAGTEFAAAQNSADFDRDGDVAILTNGNFISIYEEDDAGTGVEFKIFTGSGTLVGTIKNVSSGTNVDPQVAALANGNFVVTWHATDANNGNIEYQIFNSIGSSVAGPSTAAGTADNENEPEVVALPDGDFVLVWDNDTDNTLEARRFNSNGTPDGSTFTVENVGTTRPNLGVTPDGRILFTWLQEGGEIMASIWDPRGTPIDGTDYQPGLNNFHDTNQFTAGPATTTLNGTTAADTLLGHSTGDTLNGGSGDDLITGGPGSDLANGGSGVDNIAGGLGNDTLNGDAGDDFLNGGSGNDSLTGGDGADVANGGTGLDTIAGGPGNDTLGGDNDDDTLSGGDGDDSLEGDAGNDLVNGGAGLDNILGGTGDDTLNGDDGDDSLQGEAGNDVANGGTGLDTILGGDGNDTLNGDAGDDTLQGEAGNDLLNGGDGTDNILGGTGDDTLNGDGDDDLFTWNNGDGSDTVDGGTGEDHQVVNGDDGAGDDFDISADAAGNVIFARNNLGLFTLTIDEVEDLTVNGLAGDDTITIGDLSTTDIDATTVVVNGGDGNDRMTAGTATTALIANGDAGADVLTGGTARDTIRGGDDDDLLRGRGDRDRLYGDEGRDTLRGGGDNDRLWGGNQKDILAGAGGNDVLFGENGGDGLKGGGGRDKLFGGRGRDTLDGGGGNDILRGDEGNDRHIGGAGNDTSVFAGNMNQYNIVKAGNKIKVIAKSGNQGTDTLIGVEKLKFANKTVKVSSLFGKEKGKDGGAADSGGGAAAVASAQDLGIESAVLGTDDLLA